MWLATAASFRLADSKTCLVPVDLAGAFLDQCFAGTRQLAKFPNGSWRNKASWQQSVA
jgi:hypothetical protein